MKTLLECFGPDVSDENKRINHLAAQKSMEDIMRQLKPTIAIVVRLTEADNGDCENGCWNTGYGVEVYEQQVAGDPNTEVLLYDQVAWAGCCSSSSIDWDELQEFIEKLLSEHVAVILDLGDTSDYPESFLDVVA